MSDADRPSISPDAAYRFVVCVDVPGKSLADAYQNLLSRMSGNDWESSDEAYHPNGDPVKDCDFISARAETLGWLLPEGGEK